MGNKRTENTTPETVALPALPEGIGEPIFKQCAPAAVKGDANRKKIATVAIPLKVSGPFSLAIPGTVYKVQSESGVKASVTFVGNRAVQGVKGLDAASEVMLHGLREQIAARYVIYSKMNPSLRSASAVSVETQLDEEF